MTGHPKSAFERLVGRIPPDRVPKIVREWLLEAFSYDPHVAVHELCHVVHENFPGMDLEDRRELLRIAIAMGLNGAKCSELLALS